MTSNKQNVYNFNAGPAALPFEVLQKAQQELLNFQGTGMSVMELSHRSATYEAVHNETIARLKDLFSIPSDYEVLLLQGGASLQFSMIPMNFLAADQKAGYVMTGAWSDKAFKEATLFGQPYEVASSKASHYDRIPALDQLAYHKDDAYIHLTSNNTIFGTQWKEFPKVKDIPVIADMSSDIMSTPIDVSKFDLIYAGAQKNLGPSGVTVAIIHQDMLNKEKANTPTMLKYSTHAESNSLFNTPPTFGIYMLGEVLAWIDKLGGLDAITKRNETKAAYIYNTVDESNGFYTGHAETTSRSLMNITFNLANQELEQKFLAEAKEAGFVGLNGHRSVGGCRASTYNAVPLDACLALSEFMKQFQKING